MGRTAHTRQAALVWTAMLVILLVLMLYASDPAHASPSNRIVRIGEQYLGTPYSQMNCSEFTKKVFKRAVGVDMPADTNAQRVFGWKPKEARKGDLVYFKEHSGEGITHVGIKLSHGQILHSSNYPAFDGVVISEMRYIHGYRGARRIR